MRKKIAKISILAFLGAFLLLSFSSKKEKVEIDFMASNLPDFYAVPCENDFVPAILGKSPKLKNNYIGFREAVGFKESQGNYRVINQFGYMGKYQFGKGTLAMIGIYDTQKFLNSPALQEAAFYANASRNKWILRREIERYVGQTMNGIEITESGILAAAHLAGPGGVKRFLRSNGDRLFSDAFGTTIGYYLNKFKGYNTSFVVPNRKAKAII
ncbi:MAG TPA: peptidoglycan-binding protein LysM [Flavobacteriaceae bacterium]|nr:peptidoglycan-binding protein LysM [Flavobacteriaceae bacterium]